MTSEYAARYTNTVLYDEEGQKHMVISLFMMMGHGLNRMVTRMLDKFWMGQEN